MGSVYELDTLVLLSEELKYIKLEEANSIHLRIEKIWKLLYGLMKKLGYQRESLYS